jgi:hypothetical protein
MSRRSPPSRPFLNLLCSLCTYPCAASCQRPWTVHRCCRRILYHPHPALSTPPHCHLCHACPAHHTHQNPDWSQAQRTSAPGSASPTGSRTPECCRSPGWRSNAPEAKQPGAGGHRCIKRPVTYACQIVLRGHNGFDRWEILGGRYTLAMRFEYAGTLGLLDLDYIHPSGCWWVGLHGPSGQTV